MFRSMLLNYLATRGGGYNEPRGEFEELVTDENWYWPTFFDFSYPERRAMQCVALFCDHREDSSSYCRVWCRLWLRAVVREGGRSLRRRMASPSLSRSPRSFGPSSIQIRTGGAARDGRLGLPLRFAGSSAATARLLVTILHVSANLRVWSVIASFATTLGPCPGFMSTAPILASRRGFETGTGTKRVR